MHANQSYSLSRAVFDISDYSYSTFSAYIGIESELGTSGEGSCEFIVLGDCSVLYESGIKRRGEEPEYIQVDISGVNTLTLILTNGGDNYAADHGEWAMAKLSGSYTRTKMYEKGVYLTNLPSSLITVPNLSWDGYTIFTDKNTSGGTLSVCGEKYHKGIWMHANPQYDLSRAVVDLSGFDFTSFTVDVGIDDDQRGGTCEFELLGDGKLLVKTEVLMWNDLPVRLTADITGVKTLSLVQTNGGDGYACDWGVWGNPVLGYEKYENKAEALTAVDPAHFNIRRLSQALVYTEEDGYSMCYRLYVPSDYSADKEYPVLVFLHGAGERGTDNIAPLNYCLPMFFESEDSPARECIMLAPQCPAGAQWVNTDWTLGAYKLSEVAESRELKTVMKILDKTMTEYSVDKSRVYASGVSMGGYGTWDLLARHSDVFAAGMPFCGAGPIDGVDSLKTLPIRAAHDTADPIVPYSGSSTVAQAVKAAGGDCELMTHSYGSHTPFDYALADGSWCEWLFEQKKASAEADTEENVTTDTSPATTEKNIVSETEENTEATTDVKPGNNGAVLKVIAVAAVVSAAVAVAVFLIIKKKKR